MQRYSNWQGLLDGSKKPAEAGNASVMLPDDAGISIGECSGVWV